MNGRQNGITLSFFVKEGQRKAHYEECDAEKKRNIDKIRTMKKTIKQLQLQLGKPPKVRVNT